MVEPLLFNKQFKGFKLFDLVLYSSIILFYNLNLFL